MEEKQQLSFWERCRTGIVSYFSGTLIGVAMRGTAKEEWKQLQASEFDQAKKLSDFIGMVMRQGFAFLAAVFFFDAFQKADSWFEQSALISCAIGAFILFASMMIRIGSIIALHFAADTTQSRNRALKLHILLISIWLTALAGYGIAYLAVAIVRESSLVK